MPATTWSVERVVVPVDGSDICPLGLVTGARVARAAAVPVDALTVLDPDGEEASAARFEHAERISGVSTRERHAFDSFDAAGEIVDFAHQHARSVLSMATRGHGSVRAGVLGSTAAAVVERLGRELLLSGPAVVDDPDEPLTTLHVCVDGSDISDAIVPVAIEWARALDLRVDVVHVAAPFPAPDTPASMTRPDEAQTMALMLGVTERFRDAGLEAGWSLSEKPDVAAEIVRITSTSPGGMLAMSTHGYTGLARVLLGSVAYAILRASAVPVLALRPSGMLH